MDRRVRYEVLQNEEDDEPETQQVEGAEAPVQPAALAMVVIPAEEAPAFSLAPAPAPQENTTETTVTVENNIPEPPPYDVATELPSYEEAERSKLEEEEIRRREHDDVENGTVSDTAPLTPQQRAAATPDPQLGTDGMFLCTFMISFVFNWIGLLASLCLTQSVAGRLGAMSGFGLSLVKWVAIVKHNNWIRGVADADSWLWWLLIIMGFLIFFRGCTQYIRIKYQWTRLTQHVRNNIFYYF